MKVEYTWTADNLRLTGLHYPGKDTCVLVVHRMAGSFIADCYADVLGQELSQQSYGFIYGHNRGYNPMNDGATKPINQNNGYNTTRVGAAYERFPDSAADIEAWLETCKQFGYKKIVLMGHSLGCNKVIHYLSQHHPTDVVGIILGSPPDMHALGAKYQPEHHELIRQAKKLVKAGKPRQLLSDAVLFSAQTYLSLFEDDEIDIFPVERNPETFEQLARITQPILGLMGEHDDIAIRNIKDDMELIQSKATACPDIQIRFIQGSNHYYENREDTLAKTVLDWVTDNFGA
ncbi:MAG: alpha/beta fold hydrolase [Chloroflexi bacterium]|nr:alpha/beta fold hydrolase [Chloroflexota bacterium]